ncbi:MAG TPA: hypothetical protein V6C97_14260 [Oculatellaceae cyanobacterium]
MKRLLGAISFIDVENLGSRDNVVLAVKLGNALMEGGHICFVEGVNSSLGERASFFGGEFLQGNTRHDMMEMKSVKIGEKTDNHTGNS